MDILKMSKIHFPFYFWEKYFNFLEKGRNKVYKYYIYIFLHVSPSSKLICRDSHLPVIQKQGLLVRSFDSQIVF